MHKDGNDDGAPQAGQDDATAAEHGSDPAAAGSAPGAHGSGRLKGLAARGWTAGGGSGRGTVAGIASAVVIVATAGSMIAAASMGPRDTGGRPLEAPLTAVPAGSSVGICPGPARLLEGTPVGTDPQFSPESATAKTLVNAAVLSTNAGMLPGSRLAEINGNPLAEIAKDPGSSAPTAAAAPPALLAGVVSERAVDAVSVLSADAVGNQQATAGAVTSYTATDGDLQGAAAAGCQEPSNDLWLVGANTSLGRTAVLHLSNASSTPATVSLDLYGAKGQIQAPGSRGLLVAPGTTRSIVLAGIAPDQASLSIRARSAGGPVTAIVQQSVLRGLTPGGVDFIVPGAAPATRQVMSGVDIQDPASAKALTAKPGYADAAAALQIAVPGPADAVVEIKLYGRDGQKALPGGGVVTAKGGSVTELSLAGVPAGQYTVAASSDVSFTAAARVTRGLTSNSATDFAWSPSSARLGSQHVVTVPRAGDRYLVLGVPEGRAKITYTPITADGKVRAAATADIAGGTTALIKVPSEADDAAVLGYIVSASGDAAYGTVLLEEDGRADIAAVAVAPGAAGQEQVAVKLGY
ncbi:DUF5719 family protein [Arthrobacter sp. B10-11]|uniref:DUF5719 family protein n=1 Tax=Arthrobacter sp. B10-11 TaxID=3081160 RepID=UPI002954667D|nr:DUF5719 family protein [Arthrobacter sp. B10-11]MDV8149251.1 DUF5719 family protein [Arthrobacter sp. B10-11]